MHLNGVGIRSQFSFNVYVAGLYLPDRNRDAESIIRAGAPSRIDKRFVRDGVTKDKLTKARQDGFSANSPPAQWSVLAA